MMVTSRELSFVAGVITVRCSLSTYLKCCAKELHSESFYIPRGIILKVDTRSIISPFLVHMVFSIVCGVIAM